MKPNENCKTEITLIVDASMSEPVNADDLRKLTDGINRMVRFLAALPASGTVSVWKTQPGPQGGSVYGFHASAGWGTVVRWAQRLLYRMDRGTGDG